MHFDEIKLIMEHHLRGLSREIGSFVMIVIFLGCSSAFFVGFRQTSPYEHQGTVRIALFGDAKDVLAGGFKHTEFLEIIPPKGKTANEEIERADGADVAVDSWRSKSNRGHYLVDIKYDSGRIGTYDSVGQVYASLLKLREQIQSAKLRALGISDSWELKPAFVSAEGKSVNKPNRQLELANLSTIITFYVMALLTAVFGDYFISEERRKGSFVLVLMSPTNKSSFLLANFIVTGIVGILLAAMNFVVIMAVLRNDLLAASAITQLQLTSRTIEGIALCVPSVLVCASLAVLTSTFSNPGNKNNAMIYSIQIGIVELLAAAIFLPGYLGGNPMIRLIPISGLAVALRNAIMGHTDLLMNIISALVSLAATALIMTWSINRLRRPDMLEKLVQETN